MKVVSVMQCSAVQCSRMGYDKVYRDVLAQLAYLFD